MQITSKQIGDLCVTESIRHVRLFSGRQLIGSFPMSKPDKDNEPDPSDIAEYIDRFIKDYPDQLTKIIAKRSGTVTKEHEFHWFILHVSQSGEIMTPVPAHNGEDSKEMYIRIKKEIQEEDKYTRLEIELKEMKESKEPLNLLIAGLSETFKSFIPVNGAKPNVLNAPEVVEKQKQKIKDDPDYIPEDEIDIAENVGNGNKNGRTEDPEEAEEISEDDRAGDEQYIRNIQQALTNFDEVKISDTQLLLISQRILKNPSYKPMLFNFLQIN